MNQYIPELVLKLESTDEECSDLIYDFYTKYQNDPNVNSISVKGMDGNNRSHSLTKPLLIGDYTWLIGRWRLKEVKEVSQAVKVSVTNTLNPVETFLELTSYTCPHGNEFAMYDDMLHNLGFVRNERGNYWATVEGTSKTLFVAHLDTADRGNSKPVTRIVTTDNFVKTDGTTLLGADDKAGVTVLLYLMAKGVPGDYLLVVGEEVGCVGSSEEAKHIPQGKYNRAIQFDRRGTKEVITHQMGRRTASREFARALCKQFKKHSEGSLRLEPSDRGIFTDTKEFTGVIRECTNIAVGYTGAHTVSEVQDLSYLVTLCAVAAKVEWETLPTEQEYVDPNISYSRFSFDVTVEDDEDDQPWVSKYEEIKHKNIWEVWGDVDAGKMTVDDVRIWAIYNPKAMAALVVKMIELYPSEIVEGITHIEVEGY